MAHDIVICEALCFIRNNFDRLTTSQLKPLLSNFYKDDDLIEAKELLVKALQGSDVPRMPKRQGDNKGKQTVEDILKLFAIIDERQLADALPRFVAYDLSKIPFMNADSINIVTMAKRMENLEQRLCALEMQPVQTPGSLSPSSMSSQVPPRSAIVGTAADDVVQTETMEDSADQNGRTTTTSWSTIVAKPKKMNKTTTGVAGSATSFPAGLPLGSTQTRPGKNRQKVLGQRQGELNKSSVKAAVTIVKKAVFHIDNLDPECTADSLTVFLSANGIEVLSCFTTKSWLRGDEKNKAGAFRVCVPSAKRQQVLDPQLWTEGIMIRDWQFKNTNNGVE